jgi:hypothetical protein
MSSPEQFFEGSPAGLSLFRAVADAISTIGTVDMRVTRSQIAFRRRKGFAFVWRPDRYVTSEVPAVLSIGCAKEISSPRLKETVQVAPNVWMHHLELRHPDQLDAEVRGWLATAYEDAR